MEYRINDHKKANAPNGAFAIFMGDQTEPAQTPRNKTHRHHPPQAFPSFFLEISFLLKVGAIPLFRSLSKLISNDINTIRN